MARLNGTRLGAFRAYFFGFFVCTAGFLFGYDTGIVGELPILIVVYSSTSSGTSSMSHLSPVTKTYLQVESLHSSPTRMTSDIPTRPP